MKNFKSISLVFLALLLIVPTVILAEENVDVSAKAEVSTEKEAGFGGVFKSLRSNINKDREEMQNRLIERRSTTKTSASSTDNDSNDDQSIHINFKSGLSDFRKARISHLSEKMFSRLSAAFDRLDKIVSRIDEKVTELETKKVNMTKVKALLDDTKTSLSDGKVALSNAEAKAQELQASSDPKAALADLKAATKTVIDKISEVNTKIKSTVTELKNTNGVNATSTTNVNLKN